MALNRMKTNGLPKTLETFVDKGWSMNKKSGQARIIFGLASFLPHLLLGTFKK
jgi:hypothetical protein